MPKPRLVSSTGEFLLTVVCDTREQLPYTFENIPRDAQDGGEPGDVLTIPTVRKTLKSGDYSLVGFEDKVAIDRKSLADLYSTIASGRDRFERAMERLAAMEFGAVIVEADESEAYLNPPVYTRLTPKTVARSIDAWRTRHGVHFIFLGPRRAAEVKTFRLLERFAKDNVLKGNDK